MFWQNHADYVIKAAIDTSSHRLSGTETISYTNNSPDALDVLWVQLDQNIYRPDSRARFADAYLGVNATDGDVIEGVSVQDDNKEVPASYLVSDTRMQVRLPVALAAKGGHLRLRISWHHTVPGPWGGRTAVTPTKNGDIY